MYWTGPRQNRTDRIRMFFGAGGGGIDLEKKSSQMELMLIQDPVNHILNSDDYEKVCMNLLVRRTIEKVN